MEKKLGLRERKKIQTHNDIIKNAWELFNEKGFDKVKVAEIADMANISVKTLFTYFNSKEDIVFAGEDELINKIIYSFKNRKDKESLIEVEKKLIFKLIKDEEDIVKLEENSLIKMISNTPSIKSRLLLMWKNYEYKLADTLKKDTRLNLSDMKSKIIAINLIAPFRLLFDLMIEKEEKLNKENIENKLNDLFCIIEKGISDIK
ncbi:TetR/AcrR family transcriptional regulator [Clostridium thermobutyricum]|uniref:HTH-type transcriptional regulator LuxR n=1 Tax=Clostridium thermobutyricum DSM 4928 TaxID=1121339 RepID=A0A1V4SY08_9CLOT|nr:helix-turn-helix domain-containing protein [Clostridium thermobutyricum]OPX49018.1 HTH-type transcriptional regulator LuxR [Clostridium thermobutyricum DSM 4928]